MTQGSGGVPPGWYPDPYGTPVRRWWDGVQWGILETEFAPPPTPAAPPPPVLPPPAGIPIAAAPTGPAMPVPAPTNTTYPQVVYVQQTPPPAKRRGKSCWITLGILGGLAILTLWLLSACLGGAGSSNSGSSSSGSSATTAANTCAGKSYLDQQSADVCADTKNSVEVNRMSVTATPLKKNSNGELCSTVSYSNKSGETQDAGPSDWKLQGATGEVVDSQMFTTGEQLTSSLIVSGGTKSGPVCFKDLGKGDYVLIYDPNPYTDDRGIWFMKVP